MKKIRSYIKAIILVLRDILFEIGNDRFHFGGCVYIRYRNYLPEFINKRLIVNMLIKQGFLRQNSIAIAEAYLSYRRKNSVEVEIVKDPIQRFLSRSMFLRMPASAQEIIDSFANAENDEVLIAKGDTFKEQIEYVKRILNEKKKKSSDYYSDNDNIDI